MHNILMSKPGHKFHKSKGGKENEDPNYYFHLSINSVYNLHRTLQEVRIFDNWVPVFLCS